MATEETVRLNTEIRALEKALAQAAAEYSVLITRRTRLEQDTKTALKAVNELATQRVIDGKELPGGEAALAAIGGSVDAAAVEAARKAKAAGEQPAKAYAVTTPNGPRKILLRKPPPPSTAPPSSTPDDAPKEDVTSDDIGEAGSVADAEDAISDRLARLAADREHLMRRLARLDKREEKMKSVLGYTQRRQSQG